MTEFEFTTRDGLVLWREVYWDESGKKVCRPWQQTAAELGITAPIESNDRRAFEQLRMLLRAKVGNRY